MDYLRQLSLTETPSAQLEHGSAPKMAPGIQGFVRQVWDNLAMALDAIIESRVIQMHHANKKRKDPPTLDVGELVYLLRPCPTPGLIR